MLFKKIFPSKAVKNFITCYWIMEDDNCKPEQHKIIPDGYPEIIIHFGDPYKILIGKEWETQNDYLLAGQITKYFYLQNTGSTKAFGIKFEPATITGLFGLRMDSYVDKVISLGNTTNPELTLLKNILLSPGDYKQISLQLNIFFENLISSKGPVDTRIENAINLIFKKNGMISSPEICAAAYIGERQMLNLFKKYTGLSPKAYSNIIRLSYIFKLVQKNRMKWSSLAYEAAYFDQAHFIKDFKKLTGEKPGKYSFEEKNMANFFLVPGN